LCTIVAGFRQMLISVSVSRDNMEAVVHAEKHDNSPLDVETVKRVLEGAGVKEGIDETACSAFVAAMNALPTGGRLSQTVARGTPPVHGTDGRLELAVQYNRNPVGIADEHGSIDFHLRHPFTSIAQEQIIARIIPPTSGTPGIDVRGHKLVANAGTRVRVTAGQGTRLEAAGSELRATRAGDLRRVENTFEVLEVIRVSGNLDYSVGNIECSGAVRIDGDVLPGFHVHAGGDIWIAGVVDSAEIRSHGTVTIVQGVLPGSQVFATKGITAGYVREAYIESEGSVNILTEAVNSTVVSGDIITIRKGGRVVGGRIAARNHIHGGIAGRANAGPTTLIAGVDPLKELHAAKLASSIRRAEALQAKVSKMKEVADAGRHSDLEQMHSRIGSRKEQSAERLAQLTGKAIGLSDSRIKLQAVHPGVRIRIGPSEILIQDERHQETCFHYDVTSGHILQT
jgi:uncharacterized protein